MSEFVATRDAQLAAKFVGLADTLVDDFDVADLLDRLVHSIVELMPVEHAGLLLLGEGDAAQLVASTTETSRMLEYFQLQSGEGGPCLECLRRGVPVSVEDLSEPGQRWPQFAELGTRLGFGAVHALPLRLRQEVIGAVNLFGKQGRLTQSDLMVAQSLADMATIGIMQQRTSQRAATESEQLQRALTSRVVIEQAKGVLSEFGAVDMDRAFAALRSHARGGNLRLGDVAHALVDRTLHPRDVIPPPRGGR